MSFLLGILGAGKWLLAILKTIPWQVYAVVGGVLAILFAWHAVYVSSFNKGYNVAWAHEQQMLTKVRKASQQALQAQIEANHRPAVISAQIAETSNVESKEYYERGRRAGIEYAAAHRVRGEAGSAGGVASVPGTDQAAEKHDGSGQLADMVAVTRADFDTLTGNSLRLAKVHQDAAELIAAGVAE